MMSNGFNSDKDALSFKPELLSLTDRGLVLSFPMVRGKFLKVCLSCFVTLLRCLGTRYFDDNWFFSGVGDRKRVHIEDLVDTAIFIKEQNLTEKIAILGQGYSGAHAALTSILWEPFLFHGAALYVSTYPLLKTEIRIQSVTCQTI